MDRPRIQCHEIGKSDAAWFDADDRPHDLRVTIENWIRNESESRSTFKRFPDCPVHFHIADQRDFYGITFHPFDPLELVTRHALGIKAHGRLYALYALNHGMHIRTNAETFKRDFVGSAPAYEPARLTAETLAKLLDKYDVIEDGDEVHLFRKWPWEPRTTKARNSPLNRSLPGNSPQFWLQSSLRPTPHITASPPIDIEP